MEADGALGQADGAGGGSEAAEFGDREQGTEVTEVHRPFPSSVTVGGRSCTGEGFAGPQRKTPPGRPGGVAFAKSSGVSRRA